MGMSISNFELPWISCLVSRIGRLDRVNLLTEERTTWHPSIELNLLYVVTELLVPFAVNSSCAAIYGMKIASNFRMMLSFLPLRTRTNQAGFSLVELMIVMSLFVVLAAIAVPASTTWLASYRLKVGASEVYAALQLARSTALKENADVVIWFDVNNDTYRLYEDVDGDQNQDAGERTIKDGSIQDGVDMYSTNFGSSQTYFNSRGIAEGGGGSVGLKSSGDKYKRITLRVTGNLKIETSSDGSSWS